MVIPARLGASDLTARWRSFGRRTNVGLIGPCQLIKRVNASNLVLTFQAIQAILALDHMATLSQTRDVEAVEKFIKFRVSEELWERVNIAKVKARSSIERICTDALVRYLNEQDSTNV